MGEVDRINPLPDSKIEALDRKYLEENKVDELLGGILERMLVEKPPDPIQYMADCIEHDFDSASQDSTTGLPARRKKKLEGVFDYMNKDGTGKISFQEIRQFAATTGTSMSDKELKGIFTDFDSNKDNQISLKEFLVFFGRSAKPMNNEEFDELIKELMA
ncbi:hypothetical protein BSKO_05193 [Bryopsis sp. KO-2023]|nr:hypothetical protein BSKO_05193 [Bryopsis sp. KO-2023]